MKKAFLISLIILFIGINVKSQISYEYDDFGNAGDSFQIYTKLYDATNERLLSDFESNWDLSAIQSDSIDTVRYILPSQTMYADSFPNSNLCLENSDGSMMFLNSQLMGAELIGLATNFVEFPFSFPINNDFYIAKFPIEYGQESNNEASFIFTESIENSGIVPDSIQLPVGVDSIRLNVNIADENVIDAYGTLTLPSASHETLREKRTEQFGVVVDIHIFGVWINLPEYSLTQNTIAYRWFAKNIGYPVAEVFAGPDSVVTSVSYINESIQKTTEHKLINNLVVYPNPVRNELNIEFTRQQNFDEIQILNTQGEIVWQGLSSNNFKEVDVSKFASGYFLIKLINSENQTVATSKFIKLK